MSFIPERVDTLIFDLGGVILDLSPQATAHAFAELANIPIQDVYQAYQSNTDFNAFEKGEISEGEFRDFVRRVFSLKAPDFEIDRCWNAMLLNLPWEKLALLQKLMGSFKTILLSNTNSIHLTYIEDRLLGKNSLDHYFSKAYYSHRIGMRKPDTKIFRYLLADNRIKAEQTVFMDDILENIQAAKSIGIETIHVRHPDMLYEIFK